MKKLAKVLACVLAIAMLAGFACAADSKDVTVSPAVAEGGSFAITFDTTGLFTTDEEEYGRAWLQTYGDAITVTKVTITYDGAEVDVTDYATLDGSDGNYTLYLTPETKNDEVVAEGYLEDASTLDKVTSISYYVTLGAPADAEAAWWGGAIGTNNSTAGWNSFGQWTSAEDDRGSKEFILVAGSGETTDTPDDTTDTPDDTTDTPDTTDSTPKTGDATSIIALALVAVAAMGGVVVSSKKRA